MTRPDGSLRVFWWDRFDGVTMTLGTLEAWSEPAPAPIYILRSLERPTPEGETFVATEVEVMPRIVGDASGRAHAFWLGEASEETGTRPLLYASMAATSITWSTAITVTESATGFDVVADASGVLHLAYLRNLNTTRFPVGIYYRRSVNNGISWSTPVLLHASRYYRLLSPQDIYLQLAVDDVGGMYITWDASHLDDVLLTGSSDGGITWTSPVPVGGENGDLDARLQHGRLVPIPDGETLLLWERMIGVRTCELYQAPVSDLLAGITEGTQRVLEDLPTCPGNVQSLRFDERRVFLTAENGGGTLILATWNEEQWRRSRPLNLYFDDPETKGRVNLSNVRLVVTPALSEEGQAGSKVFVAVGTDQNNEVWIAGSRIETLAPVLAPLTPTPTPTPRFRVPESSEGEVEIDLPQPVNLSRSGAASSPAIVIRPDGTLGVFWWDQFDGLMTADGAILARSVVSGTQVINGTIEVWSDAVSAPILVAEDTSQERGAPTSINVIPRVIADTTGRTHAFWLAEAGVGATDRPLMHSTLNAGSITWTRIGLVAEFAAAYDVAIDDAGTLHLAYLRAQHTSDASSGAHYRRSDDGGQTWSEPIAIAQSRYYRSLLPESAHVRLAIQGTEQVYVTWDDPRLEQALLAGSSDGGATWSEPVLVGDPDGYSQHGRLFTALDHGQDRVWLLWEEAGYSEGCVLYQTPISEALAGDHSVGRRVLEGLTTCPDPASERFLPLGDGQVLFVVGSKGDALTLAVWDGSAEFAANEGQWSEPQRRSFRFEDTETGAPIYLSDLQAALVRIAADKNVSGEESWANYALIVTGSDGAGDVWVTPSRMGALEVVFAPPPPWSTPVNVSQGSTIPGMPAVTADLEGRVHVLWTESETPGEPGEALSYASWASSVELTTDMEKRMRPVAVLRSPEGGAEEPTLAVLGDRLHALWSGGPNGQIWYSRAFVRDAYSTSGWDAPRPLPGPATEYGIGSQPYIVASRETGDILHAVYAVPVNEERGIYYTRSEDGGTSWSPAWQVFDAAKAGWAAVDYPRLAVDARGGLHVVWIQAPFSESEPPQGIYYAYSGDDGETWSTPQQIVEGAYAWPQVVTDGTDGVHLLWCAAIGERTCWHRRGVSGSSESAEQGVNWNVTLVESIPGFGNVLGPIGAMSDGMGTLYVAGLGYNNDGALILSSITWGGLAESGMSDSGKRWGEHQTFSLGVMPGDSGLALALKPALGQLDVLFRGKMQMQDGTIQADVWHTGRTILAVGTESVVPGREATPTPVAASLTPSPSLTLLPEATPSPTPDLSTVPLLGREGDSSLLLSLLLGGGLAALIVVGVFGAYVMWVKRR
ncbi:MAG: exo-alpha-sialidase [Anaerolineae bacterium]|nr:exo-alpha-sialidase [Anaerolineae bacterium]